MTRHSKNNTTAGSFTYAERQKLEYGTQSARCTKESLRPLTHCHLCLQLAKDPTVCPQGHLACRSCFLEDILAQKTAYKVKKAEYENEIKEKEKSEKEKAEQKRLESLKTFLEQQASLRSLKRSASEVEKESSSVAIHFSSQPSDNPLKLPKEDICCRSGQKGPHPISLKTLIPVKFKEIKSDGSIGCPTCLKPLTSVLKVCLFPKCSHVVCESCYKNLKSESCFVCAESVDSKAVIVIESEGSGFAGGGGIVETKKYDLAFQ